jgi:hypothetical protein
MTHASWFADWVAQELIAVDAEGNSEVIGTVRSLPFSSTGCRMANRC